MVFYYIQFFSLLTVVTSIHKFLYVAYQLSPHEYRYLRSIKGYIRGDPLNMYIYIIHSAVDLYHCVRYFF
jgi:hypothetical protein